jgi:hypothetical protein
MRIYSILLQHFKMCNDKPLLENKLPFICLEKQHCLEDVHTFIHTAVYYICISLMLEAELA